LLKANQQYLPFNFFCESVTDSTSTPPTFLAKLGSADNLKPKNHIREIKKKKKIKAINEMQH
jgi:hypothetical protein